MSALENQLKIEPNLLYSTYLRGGFEILKLKKLNRFKIVFSFAFLRFLANQESCEDERRGGEK